MAARDAPHRQYHLARRDSWKASHDAEQRGVREGEWVRLASRAGENHLAGAVTSALRRGWLHHMPHPDTQTNRHTTEYFRLATN